MSLLTLSTQIHASGEIMMSVPPGVFHPPPKVESAVVRLSIRDTPLVDRDREAALFQLATVAFQRKRKTLGNGLAQGLGIPKHDVDIGLQSLGIDPSRRPQTLSVGEWIAVSEALVP
jgi:16S rRNA (adenine1518-N6/adenine1519-N6)-dimethyltransferase